MRHIFHWRNCVPWSGKVSGCKSGLRCFAATPTLTSSYHHNILRKMTLPSRNFTSLLSSWEQNIIFSPHDVHGLPLSNLIFHVLLLPGSHPVYELVLVNVRCPAVEIKAHNHFCAHERGVLRQYCDKQYARSAVVKNNVKLSESHGVLPKALIICKMHCPSKGVCAATLSVAQQAE